MTVLLTIILYFSGLFILSCLVGKGGNNAAFFRGNRRSPWPLVAFGMVGASISGLTFIGVPGWVMTTDMTYLQMCMGFIVGYAVVAFILLPIYYRLNLTSIYTYLHRRLGLASYQTGASFFILSKLLGAAAKFYVVCHILQLCLADSFTVPYAVVVLVALLLIWLYTHKGGIQTLVWTDAVQTFCLLLALALILLKVGSMLDMNFLQAAEAVWNSPHARIFEWEDFTSRQHFWKQFLSGIFIVIVMTGLDQDMMQKNLTCKDLRSAQKDMLSYGILFLPVNFLFLSLGILLLSLHQHQGLPLPAQGDDLLTSVVLDGTLGTASLVFFTIGVIASAFSSADSALTALTTSFCVDILRKSSDEKKRQYVHLGMTVLFAIVTIVFNAIGTGSVMDLIYTLVSYTYGPLLGLFAFAMITRRQPHPAFVPVIAILSPVLCYLLSRLIFQFTGYQVGYEMLMFNGLIVFAGLFLRSKVTHTHIQISSPNPSASL